MINSGFTCPHSQLCTSLISAEFTAEALVTSYSTISGVRTSYIAGTSTATVTPPATIHADMVQLLYRASDIPDGFSNSPAHGARLSEYTPNLTPLPDDIITSPDWAGTKVLMAPGRDNPSAIAAGVGVSSVIVGLIALFVFRMRHKRNLKRAGEICQPRNPKPVWHQGNVPALPSFFAFPLGIISVLFGLQREWQEDMILRWGSKNAVLHFIQILSFFLRTCATALVWSVVVDCGWLLLASGMPALRFVGLWDMSAIGGSYMYVFSWGKRRGFHC